MGNGVKNPAIEIRKRRALIFGAAATGCLAIWVTYYLGGGEFERSYDLGFTFLLSLFVALLAAGFADAVSRGTQT